MLRRLLDAAHHAPSVGFMQPWNFIVVRDRALRARLHAHFREVSDRAARDFPGDRGETYRSLKLQGILDAPVNLLVTCDRSRGGPNVLGRSVQRDTDVYSTCLAVQNLWLAAHAEGVGVGWMSIAHPDTLRTLFELPESVLPVAYLTLGWPVELPDTPLIERVGWRRRVDLDTLVFAERWGRPADLDSGLGAGLPPAEPPPAPPERIREAVATRRAHLTRPPGSLGRLEDAVERIAVIQGHLRPRAHDRVLLLLAGDHGVTAEGVSAYRPEVTARMVTQFVSGGAAVCAIAREHGIRVQVADLGVDHDFSGATAVVDCKVGRATSNIAEHPAMSRAQREEAIEHGVRLVADMDRPDLLAVGEMGIGNSTVAAAMAAALLDRDPEELVGIGTGVGPGTRAHKVEVVRRALVRHGADRSPDGVLASLGGFEIAGLVGVMEEAARQGIPVILDSFITGVAALVAVRRTPTVSRVLLAGHRSAEPGHRLVLEALGLDPILDLDLRLGEGSGAALALGLLAAGCRVDAEMCTFEEAGIEHPEVPGART
ncbi:MAG: nicotinate-nucleotide--dimethylbenzimidazole phosphoribosyltransferase [Deltaproteobacteria bacterium]|nr:MAG: nicotinate-nucleotide--dimethylbenzimidazole phosphoribosyltransferase [Deltaproteobacteria bacterium]